MLCRTACSTSVYSPHTRLTEDGSLHRRAQASLVEVKLPDEQVDRIRSEVANPKR